MAFLLLKELCRTYAEKKERFSAIDAARKISQAFGAARSVGSVVNVIQRFCLEGVLTGTASVYTDRASHEPIPADVWDAAVEKAKEREREELEIAGNGPSTGEPAPVQALSPATPVQVSVPDVVLDDQTWIERLIKDLKKGPCRVGEISRNWDRAKESVQKIITLAVEQGYDITIDPASNLVMLRRTGEELPTLDLVNVDYRHLRFAAFSDTHLGSKYQQVSLLRQAYAVAAREGVHFAVHAGDVLDGFHCYRYHEQEIFLIGADDQRAYAEANYPEADFKTYMLEGNHDESFRKVGGHSAVKLLCEHRSDLIYRGCHTAKFKVKGLTIQMLHGSGGGAYARSYKPQKLAEAVIGQAIADIRAQKDMEILPDVILIGHYHYFIHFDYMGSEVFVLPCFQSQTPYLARKGLTPTLGFCLIDLDLDNDGDIGRVMCRRVDWTKHGIENDYIVEPSRLEAGYEKENRDDGEANEGRGDFGNGGGNG